MTEANELGDEGPTREQFIAEVERLTLQLNSAVAALNQVHVAVEVLPGPDNRPRLVVLFQVGPMATQIQMDLDNAPGFADHVHRLINEKHAEAKRAASGFVVADASVLSKLGPLAGTGG